jgi:hypothetical protein
MKKDTAKHWSASPDEFRQTVECEFDFLCKEHGYELVWSNDNPFEATFEHGKMAFWVTGESYGFSAMVYASCGSKDMPLWPIMTKLTTRFTPRTDKPQLDDLRELAYRLKNECLDVVSGDLKRLDEVLAEIEIQRAQIDEQRQADKKGMFFSNADKLWKNKKYSDLITLLRKTDFKLSPVWLKRLEYAEKHA